MVASTQERSLTVVPVRESRIALVIGNGAYQGSPLKNPANDARAMADVLKTCGFTVTKLENANRIQMREAIRSFGARIADGGVGLFYFAGHGMQVKGRNYLLPVGADVAQEDEIAGEAVEVDAVLAKMETARNRMNILILDACRNNPFGTSSRSSQQGLAQVDAPTGTFVAFATAPGRTAADGRGEHGIYTSALLRQIKTRGLKLEDVFKRTRSEVLQASDYKQTPWENSSIVGEFEFISQSVESLHAQSASPVRLPAPPVVSALVGGLQVSVNAPETTVYVDGQLIGSATNKQALNLEGLPVGSLTVRVEARGYEPQQQRVLIREGEWTQAKILLSKPQVSSPEPRLPNVKNLAQLFNGELPGILQMLREFKTQEALVKVQALIPTERPSFDGSTGPAIGASLDNAQGLMSLHKLHATVTSEAGLWERAVEIQEHRAADARSFKADLDRVQGPIAAQWAKVSQESGVYVVQKEPRKVELEATVKAFKAEHAALSADLNRGKRSLSKQERDDFAARASVIQQQEQELAQINAALPVHKQNQAAAPKVARMLADNSRELDGMIKAADEAVIKTKRTVTEQNEEIEAFNREQAKRGRSINGNRAWVNAVLLDSMNLSRLGSSENQMAFLNRLLVLDPGNPMATNAANNLKAGRSAF